MSEMELAIMMQAVMTFVMVLGVLVVLFRQGVPAADKALSEGIQSRLDDRRFIQELEDRYKALNGQQQAVFQTMLAFMQITAPLTPIKSDDKVADLLADIMEPGAPAGAAVQVEMDSATEAERGVAG